MGLDEAENAVLAVVQDDTLDNRMAAITNSLQ